MGTVYLAEDMKHSRRVALKVLRPELTEMLRTKDERITSPAALTRQWDEGNAQPGQAQDQAQGVSGLEFAA